MGTWEDWGYRYGGGRVGTESFNPEFPCDAAGKGSGVDTAVAQGRCCGKV